MFKVVQSNDDVTLLWHSPSTVLVATVALARGPSNKVLDLYSFSDLLDAECIEIGPSGMIDLTEGVKRLFKHITVN